MQPVVRARPELGISRIQSPAAKLFGHTRFKSFFLLLPLHLARFIALVDPENSAQYLNKAYLLLSPTRGFWRRHQSIFHGGIHIIIRLLVVLVV